MQWHDNNTFRKLLTCGTGEGSTGSCNCINNYFSHWEVTVWKVTVWQYYSLYIFVWQIYHSSSKISINYLLHALTVQRATPPWVSHTPTCLTEYAKNT